MKLTELVRKGAVVPNLAGTERDAVLEELVDALIADGALDATAKQEVLERIKAREARGSTGFGRGVAVPHVKHPAIEKMTATIGLSQQGVDFNALDKQPVYSVFLLLSPENKPEEHLQAMESIFKNLSKDTFRRFLQQATTTQDVMSLLDEADNHLLAG